MSARQEWQVSWIWVQFIVGERNERCGCGIAIEWVVQRIISHRIYDSEGKMQHSRTGKYWDVPLMISNWLITFRPKKSQLEKGTFSLSSTNISSPWVPVVYVSDRSDRSIADFLSHSFDSAQRSRPTSNTRWETRIDANATVDRREASIIHERKRSIEHSSKIYLRVGREHQEITFKTDETNPEKNQPESNMKSQVRWPVSKPSLWIICSFRYGE